MCGSFLVMLFILFITSFRFFSRNSTAILIILIDLLMLLLFSQATNTLASAGGVMTSFGRIGNHLYVFIKSQAKKVLHCGGVIAHFSCGLYRHLLYQSALQPNGSETKMQFLRAAVAYREDAVM